MDGGLPHMVVFQCWERLQFHLARSLNINNSVWSVLIDVGGRLQWFVRVCRAL